VLKGGLVGVFEVARVGSLGPLEVGQSQLAVDELDHLLAFAAVDPSIDVIDLYLFLFLEPLLILAEAALAHLVSQFQAQSLRVVPLWLDQHTGEHAVLKIPYVFLVVQHLLVFPSLEFFHLLLDDFLVAAQRSPAFEVLVSLVPIKDAVVHVGECLDLGLVLLVFVDQLLVQLEQVHVLLVLPLDFLVVLEAVQLHLLHPALVPLLLDSLHLALLLLAEPVRLSHEQSTNAWLLLSLYCSLSSFFSLSSLFRSCSCISFTKSRLSSGAWGLCICLREARSRLSSLSELLRSLSSSLLVSSRRLVFWVGGSVPLCGALVPSCPFSCAAPSRAARSSCAPGYRS